MQVPVFNQEQTCGQLRAEQRGLYTIFRGEVTINQVLRLYAIFEEGELALGIPAPEQGKMVLHMSVPTSRLPRGKLLYGILRSNDSIWTHFPGGKIGNQRFPPGRVKGNRYQFPWQQGEELPCEPLMCFFQYLKDGKQEYLEITLDEQGHPCV